jgi:hypothetical protein
MIRFKYQLGCSQKILCKKLQKGKSNVFTKSFLFRCSCLNDHNRLLSFPNTNFSLFLTRTQTYKNIPGWEKQKLQNHLLSIFFLFFYVQCYKKIILQSS